MTRPDGAALLALERQARHHGSGLPTTAGAEAVAAGPQAPGARHPLIGTWRLEQLWSARDDRPMPQMAALLRGFGACLRVGEPDGEGRFPLANAVGLGRLTLTFHGQAVLSGRRPLLVFGFDRLTLGWGEQLLWQRTLPAAAAPLTVKGTRRQPFFALIGADRSQGWLAARGRGGGLALWGLEAPAIA